MNRRLVSLAALAALLVLGAWAAAGLRLDNDLTRFMPAPANADERLVAAEIGRGPATRLLLLAIAGEDIDQVTRLSRALQQSLVDHPAIERIINGEFDELAALQQVMPLRFSHSPAMDSAQFDSDALTAVLEERLADLGSVGGETFDHLLEHDPHLLTVAMLAAWRPANEPRSHDGVWVTSGGEALLLVQTRAGGFDTEGQVDAVQAIQDGFDALDDRGQARLTVSGPGSFSARMSERVRAEATRFGVIASVGVVLLLLLAYRSPVDVVAASLPLACAAAAGLAAVRLGFDQVHGITLAFAFTLIGVAQDYPVHLLSHRRPGQPVLATARHLWPALRLSAASTAIAYLSLFSAHAQGLAQLAVFTIAGLLAAALTARYLLPSLLPVPRRDVLTLPGVAALARAMRRIRGGAWPVVPVLLLAGVAVIAGQSRPWWNNDLGALTPLPAEWLAEDARLRTELATADARWLLVLTGADIDAVLRLSEALQPRFDALVEQGALADHGLPSRFQPSSEVRRWRLAKLPAAVTLRAAMADASDRTGFDPLFFEPMIADVQRLFAADAGTWLADAFRASPAGDRYAAAMRQGDGGAYALVELVGMDDPGPIHAAVADQAAARLIDVKQVAEAMVADYRSRVVAGLVIAAGTLLGVLILALGPRSMLRVLPTVLLGLVVTVSVLRLVGVELGLFHLIALILAAGLGMDYALFFQHARTSPEQARTLHAVVLSSLSTLGVFGLLALSSIPVLRAIGLTVAIGVAAQFVLALLMARPATPDAEPGHA